MRIGARELALGLFASLALAASAQAAAQAFGLYSRPPSLVTEATGNEGKAGLEVRAFGDSGELEGLYGGAEVFVDHESMGWAPFSTESLKPGTYRVEVRASGYYPSFIVLSLSAKTRYKLRFSLRPVTGLVEIEVEPPDASLLIDGTEAAPGSFELKAGRHRLVARRFAYLEKSLDFEVSPLSPTRLSLALEPAAFEVSELRASKPSFNPRSPGPFGSVSLGFRVSSYGKGRLELRSESGELVFERDFPSFSTWAQGTSWDGRGPEGKPLPDGLYTASLEARAATGEAAPEAAPERRSASIRIDSSLRFEPFGSQGGSRGLLYLPDPRPVAQAVLGLELGASESLSDWASPALSLSAAYNSGLLDLGLAFALEPASSGSGLEAAASLRHSFFGPSSPFAAALQLRGLYSSSGEPLAPGYEAGLSEAGFALEASLPLALSAGPFRLGLAPGLLEAFPLASGAETRLILGSGLWLSGSRYGVGLSARALCLPSLELASPLYAAAEARYLLAPAPLLFSASLSGSFEAEAAPSLRLGLGLGLLL